MDIDLDSFDVDVGVVSSPEKEHEQMQPFESPTIPPMDASPTLSSMAADIQKVSHQDFDDYRKATDLLDYFDAIKPADIREHAESEELKMQEKVMDEIEQEQRKRRIRAADARRKRTEIIADSRFKKSRAPVRPTALRRQEPPRTGDVQKMPFEKLQGLVLKL